MKSFFSPAQIPVVDWSVAPENYVGKIVLIRTEDWRGVILMDMIGRIQEHAAVSVLIGTNFSPPPAPSLSLGPSHIQFS